MNEEQQLMASMTRRILSDHCDTALLDQAEQGQYPEVLWSLLETQGLTSIGASEAFGGAGGSFCDALVVLRETGRYALPLPLAETIQGASLLSSLGAALPDGPIVIASGDFALNADHRLVGSASDVRFGRHAKTLLVVAQTGQRAVLCQLLASECEIEIGANLAGEPSDTVTIDQKVALAHQFPLSREAHQDIETRGAAVRSVMMAGALEEALSLTVGYALERRQFGKPIAKFQAVQQQLAVFATQVAASTRAAETLMVTESLSLLDVAIAKARIGEAAGLSAEIAHQVHGAIGYTKDHQLNHLTRRLWSWRDEFGHEGYWQERLGRKLLADTKANLWHQITAMG
ncbi:MAG: acyl-CoA dehydrogenase family protein [Pseudomonadales bacterium]